ncbi:hypothetical protein LPJ73_004418, partial [Coemansia sp. RSA 2703]
GGYSRAPGYGGFRDDLSEDDNMRRDIDKERAIEELRLRVRATTERPVTPRDRSRSATRASYAIPPPASTVKPDMPSKSRGTLGVGSDNTGANLSSPAPLAASVVAPAATSETATVTKGDTSVAPEVGNSVSTAGATAINMDDIEEGEHIEGEVEKPVSSRYTPLQPVAVGVEFTTVHPRRHMTTSLAALAATVTIRQVQIQYRIVEDMKITPIVVNIALVEIHTGEATLEGHQRTLQDMLIAAARLIHRHGIRVLVVLNHMVPTTVATGLGVGPTVVVMIAIIRILVNHMQKRGKGSNPVALYLGPGQNQDPDHPHH